MWFKQKVYNFNLELINECNMSWDEVLDTWYELITEARNRMEENE